MAKAELTQSVVGEIRQSHNQKNPLPGSAYRDESIFELEASALINKGWVSLSCGQVAPEPGDVFPVTFCKRELVIVRQKNGGIRVFYNLCRHRGARLVEQPCRTKAGLLVCPYHAWSYFADGRLAAAPEYFRDGKNSQPDGSEKEKLGLIEVPSRLWRDIIFVSLAHDQEPFQDWIRPIDQHLSEWDADELRPLGSREFLIRANWKLAAENFLDVYHLPFVHPQLGGGLAGALASEDLVLAPHIFGFRMPEGYGPDSRMDSRTTPRFSSLSERNQRSIEVFCIFPNTLILVEPDWQQVITLRPQSADAVAETFADYLTAGDSVLDDSERAELFAGSAEVNDQDQQLLEGQQRSRSMPEGGQTVMSKFWDKAPAHFQKLWSERILDVL
jgi:choline monooxygenase